MMLRGLGMCVTFNASDLYSAWGTDQPGVNVNQMMFAAGTNNGCIPDSYLSYIPQDYIATHGGESATTTPIEVAKITNSPAAYAPAPDTPLPPLVDSGITDVSVATPGPITSPPYSPPSMTSSSGSSTISAPLQMPPINIDNTAVAGASASSASGTIFGINSTYVLIGGAVLAFMFLGGKR